MYIFIISSRTDGNRSDFFYFSEHASHSISSLLVVHLIFVRDGPHALFPQPPALPSSPRGPPPPPLPAAASLANLSVPTGVPTAPLPHATWLPTGGDDGDITWLHPPSPPPPLPPPSGGDDVAIGGVHATCGCGHVWWGALGRVGARGSTTYLDLAALALHSRRMCPGHK